MRCYEVSSGGVQEGICTKKGKILLGEEGRGRHLVEVPAPLGGFVGNLLMEVPGRPSDALVVVHDHSGYRGGWSLTGARAPEEWDQMFCTAEPLLSDRSLPKEVLILAQGECAQGDAGRMGGGPEYLLVLPHGQAVEIVRRGRLYGAPAVVRLDCQAGEVTASVPRHEAEKRAAARKLGQAILPLPGQL